MVFDHLLKDFICCSAVAIRPEMQLVKMLSMGQKLSPVVSRGSIGPFFRTFQTVDMQLHLFDQNGVQGPGAFKLGPDSTVHH